MADTLKARIREKLLRQLNEDGPPDTDSDDPRLNAITADLETLDAVPDGDPLLEELAARYLVP